MSANPTGLAARVTVTEPHCDYSGDWLLPGEVLYVLEVRGSQSRVRCPASGVDCWVDAKMLTEWIALPPLSLPPPAVEKAWTYSVCGARLSLLQPHVEQRGLCTLPTEHTAPHLDRFGVLMWRAQEGPS